MKHLTKCSYCQKWNIRNFQEKNQNKLKDLKSEGLSIQSIKNFAQELKIQKKSFKCIFCTEPYGYLLITKRIEGLM